MVENPFFSSSSCTVVGRHFVCSFFFFPFFHRLFAFLSLERRKRKENCPVSPNVDLDAEISGLNYFLSFCVAGCRSALDPCNIPTAPSPIPLFLISNYNWFDLWLIWVVGFYGESVWWICGFRNYLQLSCQIEAGCYCARISIFWFMWHGLDSKMTSCHYI